MGRPWVTARLTNLAFVNYRVPADVLLPYVPRGAELDTPDGEPDLHLVSLVALHFGGTRLYGAGVSIPGAQRFTQVNIRMYVRRGPMRGVVFLRELVTAPAVALGARLVYREPLSLAALSHRVEVGQGIVTVRTSIEAGAHQGEVRFAARDEPALPGETSRERFLTERHWSFYRARSGQSFHYRLSHPAWRTYPVERTEVTVDPGALLGREWQVIDWQAGLHSAAFAEGSMVTVYLPEPVTGPLDTM